MGWLSKVMGIDAKRDAKRQAAEQAKKTAAAEAAALEVQRQVAERQKQYSQSLTNMQTLAEANKIMERDVDPSSNVVAGGSAEDVRRKKRASFPSVAASLGINI